MYSFDIFPNFEPVSCPMPGSNCCFLARIQVSQEIGKMLWYFYFFKNFPQFVVIHTVKGFSVINRAEVDFFGGKSLAVSMIQRMFAIWSLVPLSFLNPVSTSESPQFIYCWTLAWRILSMTLLAYEMSTNHLVILLKCRFWSSWSGVGTEILYLLEAPRWCWYCWLENCTFSNKTLTVLLSLMSICISGNSCSISSVSQGRFKPGLCWCFSSGEAAPQGSDLSLCFTVGDNLCFYNRCRICNLHESQWH